MYLDFIKKSVVLCFILVSVFSFSAIDKIFEDEDMSGPSLTLYFLPSPAGMNYSSPSSLLRSLFQNELKGATPAYLGGGYDHVIGHVFIRVQTADGTRLLTGITNKTKEGDIFSFEGQKVKERDLLFKEGVGLGLMFYQFRGVLNDPQDIIRKVRERASIKKHPYPPGKINFVKYLISDETAQRLIHYHEKFEDLEKKQLLRYGLFNNPRSLMNRESEGAGCSAFGASFVTVAGLNDDYVNNWSLKLTADKGLIGGNPSDVPLISEARNVPIGLIQKSRTWGKEETSQSLYVWDVDRMFRWVSGMHQGKQENLGGREQLKVIERLTLGHSMKGIVVDGREQKTPDEAFFGIGLGRLK